ncbi:MAG TPA: HdeD family acid-resistance protein, partial [Xanthobacteraceae bacterium]|nr:HdeD family acid-resistance protein [Xanthobacteraceae bacterium]
MTTATAQSANMGQDVREAIHGHWGLFLIQGLIMIVLGVLAIGEPMVATIAVALFAGWLFLISGIVGLASMFTTHRMPGFWWPLISSVLAILVGIYLIWRPLVGVLSLTLVVAAYFGAQGIVQIITSIEHRRVLPSWGWMVFGGVVNLLLAAIILSGWPGTAEWTLGLLFGINLLMWG